MRRHVTSLGIAVLIFGIAVVAFHVAARVGQGRARNAVAAEMAAAATSDAHRAEGVRLLEATHGPAAAESVQRTLLVLPRHDGAAYREAGYRLMIGEAIEQDQQELAIWLESVRAGGVR